MLVLHAHWLPPPKPFPGGGFLFWAESSPDERHRRRPTDGSAKHPYARSAAALRKHAEVGRFLDAAKTGKVTLLLPTLAGQPLPSPALDGAGETAVPEERLWEVPGLRLLAAEAAQVLISLPTASGALKGIVLGDDCLYWRLVAGLAIEAVAAQKLIPGFAPATTTRYRATWAPVLDAPQDDARVSRLRQAMPPVCRAGPDAAGRYPAPDALLDTVLTALVESLVRSWAPEPSEPSGTYYSYAGSGSYFSPGPRQAHYGVDALMMAWLDALTDQKGTLPTAGGSWETLLLKHQAWTRPLRVAAGSNFRAAFRLQVPGGATEDDTGLEAGSDAWRLHYALQARDDPSLLVPAETVWDAGAEVAAGLGQEPQRAREVLLAALGSAARVFPPIAGSLKGLCPDGCSLDTTEAYAFLREAAPLLEQSGFTVLVPPWWSSTRARLRRNLRLRARASEPPREGAGAMGFDRLVSFRWELALGDTTLSRAEFEALAALKTPLVQIRGEWVHLDPEQAEAAIAFWKKGVQEGETSLLEAMRLGTAPDGQSHDLPVDTVSAEGWLDDWLDRLTGEASLEPLPQPASLCGELRPYQVHGFSWLAFLRRYGIGGILADDMGLGKTIQALALLLREKEALGSLPAPTLLVAPTSVVANWEREASRFAPQLEVIVHHGASRVRGEALAKSVRGADLVLTSYTLARRDAAALKTIGWYGVILDEAQNVKNPASAQSRAVRALSAQFRFALTGTPVENRLSELWSIMSFLNPGHLGSLEGFRRRYGTPIERYGDEEARENLRHLVGPLILRRMKTDPRVAPDLPEKVETNTYCRLTEEQATLYEAAVRDAMRRVDQTVGIERRGMVLTMLMQLKQICNHPVQFLHQAEDAGALEGLGERSGKLQRLTELLEEITAVGDRTLVFTQFAEMAGLLRDYLDRQLGYPTLLLTGATPASKRQQLVERFQADGGDSKVFVISLKAGGTGLNLTAANHVIHYDRWWNPAVEDQATDRAHRIGQHRNVQVHKFVSLGTLEEAIDELIESKRALARAVIGGGENWLTELSTDDLRRLVELRP